MENHKDFIVGRKYRNRLWVDPSSTVTCIGHKSDGKPVFETPEGQVRSIDSWGYYLSEWLEVREPLEFWLFMTGPHKADVYNQKPDQPWQEPLKFIKVREVIE